MGELGVWLLALAMPIGGVLLARHNLRLGRVDRKGAFRVALFVFVTYALARLFRADHVAAFGDELWILIKVLAYPAFWARAGLAPLHRPRALRPAALAAHAHLLEAAPRRRLRRPLVGRDVLIGAVAGTCCSSST